MKTNILVAAGSLLLASCGSMEQARDQTMSFFVSSQGSGDGANFGGVSGADRLCQQLAAAAGEGNKTWRAYLSSSAGHARDRIGSGPWHNANGELIAANLVQLHGEGARIGKQSALTEQGEVLEGRGDQPNRHDILTGSNADGTHAEGHTCNDWYSSGEGSAMVGHHDRIGLRDDAPSRSWNASHPSRGCSIEALRATGGDGRVYCFALSRADGGRM